MEPGLPKAEGAQRLKRRRIAERRVVFCHRERNSGADITRFVSYDFLLFKNEIVIVNRTIGIHQLFDSWNRSVYL